MVIGSAGRNELVLSSDQDNAIIYDDSPEVSEPEKQSYFIKLGEKISGRLQKSGLQLCPGNYMASNSKWCQPLSVWKEYFAEWIETPDPENILNVSVFFDLRFSYGSHNLFDELNDHVFTILNGKTTFFYLLAQSVATYKPPQNIFGGILSSNVGSNEILDLKSCISQIVMFARIYALRKNIRLTNTIQRIEELHNRGILSTSTTEELLFQFKFFTQKRIEKQLKEKMQGAPLTNNINPKKLSEIEQMILKKLLSQMGNYHEKLSAEFMSAFKG
jgi:CBS domain-containing protein